MILPAKCICFWSSLLLILLLIADITMSIFCHCDGWHKTLWIAGNSVPAGYRGGRAFVEYISHHILQSTSLNKKHWSKFTGQNAYVTVKYKYQVFTLLQKHVDLSIWRYNQKVFSSRQVGIITMFIAKLLGSTFESKCPCKWTHCWAGTEGAHLWISCPAQGSRLP